MKRYVAGAIGLALLAAVGLATRLQPRAERHAAQSVLAPAHSDLHPPRIRQRSTTNRLPLFVDVASQSGVSFRYRNGEEAGHNSILESLGGGVALWDFDGDDRLDLFCTGGGRFDGEQISGLRNGLFRNRGALQFDDQTGAAALSGGSFYSHGCAVGDYDNDGWPDLVVTGYGGIALYRNQGDGTFQELTRRAAVSDPLWSTSAAWADFDGDGALDLYLAHYVNWSFQNHPRCTSSRRQPDICSPKQFQPLPDALYYNNGDGTFREVGQAVGLRRDGKALGVVVADIDTDGDTDIYVANDTTDNFLYLNRGDGRFDEVGLRSGVALSDQGIADGSMGVDVADYNGDGRADIWVVNYERESFALYRNDGNGFFTHASQTSGVTALGQLYVSFGTAFLDFDRDGQEDLFIANGHVLHYPNAAPVRQLPILFRNAGQSRFKDASGEAGPYFAQPHRGRGAATADLDNDGDIDVVVSHTNEPVALLRNDSATGCHWLRLRLIGRRSNRDAVGGWGVAEAAGRRKTCWVKGGGSYLSHSDRRPFFGFGSAERVDRLTVYWSCGAVQEIPSPQLDQSLLVWEPY